MNKLVTDKDWYANTWPSPNYHGSDILNRLVEEKDSFSIRLNLAGASKESINISYDDHMLTVLGKTDEGIDYHYRCHVPRDKVNTKKAKSKYENGILTVVIPKLAIAKPISIKVD
jgi:HSP20 family molecular chaperone IbpA